MSTTHPPIPVLSPRPGPQPLGLLATHPLAIERASYVRRLMAHDFKAEDDAAVDELIELEALRERVDADYILWNMYAPPEFCAIPEDDEGEDDDNECSVCRGTGEGRHEGASCVACRGRGYLMRASEYGL